MKKEELIAISAEQKGKIARLEGLDETRRKEFAKAFAWYKLQQPYQYRNEANDPQTPTWEQIFVNIGYLTAQRDFRNYEGNISELEMAVEGMKKNWDKYFEGKRGQ